LQRDATTSECWKAVGWNGVRLSVPESWHPAGIERQCLVFERNARLVMTLKWEPSKSRGSSRPGIFRIRKGFPRELRHNLREIVLPDAWRCALDGNFEKKDVESAAAFSWGDPAGGGEGLLFDCRWTRRVFLLHFYRSGISGDTVDIPRILASLRNGSEDGGVVWAVFDIRAVVPEALRLVRHRFMPGAFELTFGARGETVRLCRWGPASVLLRNETLQAFAADRFAIPHDKIEGGDAIGSLSVQWIDRHMPAWAAHRLIKPFVPPVFRRGRAWHIPGPNKILAVQIEARSLPAGNFLDDLCGSFQCLPTGQCLPAGKETLGPPA
jgi:hypothetical protein